MRAYSGVSLHVSKALHDEVPVFAHPAFDMESRIVTVTLGNLLLASVYVPNGGKDYPAKLDFFTKLAAWAAALVHTGRDLVLCGDLNIAHADIDVHPRERERLADRDILGRALGGRRLVEDGQLHVTR